MTDYAGAGAGLVYSRGMKARVRRQGWALALALVGAWTAGGCVPYRVVQESVNPSALKGVRDVTVSYDWTQVRFSGKTEAEYVAEKKPEERTDHEVVKTEIDGAILAQLRAEVGAPYTFNVYSAPPGIGELRLVIQYAEVQTGLYAYFVSSPTKVLTRFIWIRDGKVTDMIDADTTVQATMQMNSDHERMTLAGQNLGRAAADYFIAKQQGK